MNSKIHHSLHRRLFFILLLVYIACIFFSKYILSMSIFGLLALCFIKLDYSQGLRVSWRNTLHSGFSGIFRNSVLWMITALFFLTLLSGINSSNSWSWLHMVKMHLPFLALPFVFINHSNISENEYKWIHYFFIFCCFVSSVLVSVQYGLNFDVITEGIGKGKSLPVPHSPPHYSILISFGFLSGLLSLETERDKLITIILILVCILLFLFLHFLAARAGLLATYLGLLWFGVQKIVVKRRWTNGLLLLAFIGIFPLVAYHTVPGFQKKVDYTIYDSKMRLKGAGQSYSDSERLMSIHAGLDVFKRHFLIGSGIGDLNSEMEMAYRDLNFEMSQIKKPHNQFVLILAGYGFIGLMIFLGSIYWPFLSQHNYKHSFFFVFHLVMFVLFMVESPLGSSSIIAFYLLFTMLNLSLLKSWSVREDSALL